MLQPPIPDDEARRLALLAACRIMYTPAEQAFDDVAQLAADLCAAEIALITLVDADYQWFKARVGIKQEGTARDLSFCGHCIIGRQPFVVEDTHRDARFADNPLVTGEPFLRSYTGVPLLVDGAAVGALSVADRVPRRLAPRQLDGLQRLAQRVSCELQLRRELERAKDPDAPAPPRVDGDVLAPGAVVGGRWKVVRELGRGGVGAVYEAHDPNGGRVAIKVMLPAWGLNQDLLERFAREARILMRIDSPHVGRLYEVGNFDSTRGGLPYLVLEFLEGHDLEHVIDYQPRVPVAQGLGWCADACDGVAAAHELGVVHRDLKPSNVFLASATPAPIVKVLDFGIAAGDPAAISVRITGNDEVMGSPAYMSPEQMMGAPSLDGRSDIWSMGALLYELLTTKLPFPGETALQMFSNAMARPPIPMSAIAADIPASVQAIVSMCLRKDPGERYESMPELARALRSVAQTQA